jgi:hypothetical protein
MTRIPFKLSLAVTPPTTRASGGTTHPATVPTISAVDLNDNPAVRKALAEQNKAIKAADADYTPRLPS